MEVFLTYMKATGCAAGMCGNRCAVEGGNTGIYSGKAAIHACNAAICGCNAAIYGSNACGNGYGSDVYGGRRRTNGEGAIILVGYPNPRP
eukprot:672299-Rhodomonas_salina.1